MTATLTVLPLSVRRDPNPAVNITFRATVTLPGARLGHLAAGLRPDQPRKTVSEIQKVVAAHYGLTQDDMLSDRRARDVARPRQVAMWLCKQITKRSLPDIGRRFGGRDHTTVLHAVRRIDSLVLEDEGIWRDCGALLDRLGGRPT